MVYKALRNAFLCASIGIRRVKRASSMFVCFLFVFAFCHIPFRTLALPPLPEGTADVLLIQVAAPYPGFPNLPKAISAQLSVSGHTVKKIVVTESEFNLSTPLSDVRTLVTKHHSTMAIWLQRHSGSCTVFLYSPNDQTHILNRTVYFDSSSSDQSEVIANAVSSLVERTTTDQQIHPSPSPNPVVSVTTRPPRKAGQQHRYTELRAGYFGEVFAEKKISRGLQLGIGFLPGLRIATTLLYTELQNHQWKTNQYSLVLDARQLDLALATRLVRPTFEFRIGLAYAIAFRSLSGESFTDAISNRPRYREVIHSVSPFIAILWKFQTRVSLFVNTSARISLNERIYKILRIDDNSTLVVAAPFPIKPAWQLGLVFHL